MFSKTKSVKSEQFVSQGSFFNEPSFEIPSKIVLNGFFACILIGALIAVSGCSLNFSKGPLKPSMLVNVDEGQTLFDLTRTVVIDTGHGGHDPGARHHGLEEKQLALDISIRLRTILEQAGLTVVMTRDSDRFIPLSERAELANRLKADLFLSIHLNANPDSNVSGAAIYYPRKSVVSPDIASSLFIQDTEVNSTSDTLQHVLWGTVPKRTYIESNQLAGAICNSFKENLKVKCVDKPARFVVLRETLMPAVLIEIGYMSNKDEALLLGSSEYRQTAAESVAKGLIDYIRELEVQHTARQTTNIRPRTSERENSSSFRAGV